MEYKRSKALYLGILAGVALIAGIAHSNPSTGTITVHIDAPAFSSQDMQVVEINKAKTVLTNQNQRDHEEADNAAAVLVD